MSGLPNGTYTIRATYIGTTSQAGKVEITIDRADLENVAIVLDGTTGGDDGDYTYEASGKEVKVSTEADSKTVTRRSRSYLTIGCIWTA